MVFSRARRLFLHLRVDSADLARDLQESTMPVNVVKSKEDEKKWSRAKAKAAEQGHAEDWDYVMSIFQSMKGKKKNINKTAFLDGYMFG